jgi:DnaJ-class molecular chaperone
MPRQRDHYATLGISRDATPDDIKKAYRRLAIQHHPDKNPGNEETASVKFKEIAAAYEVLSDPNKRSQYDRFGDVDSDNGGLGRGGAGGFHMDEVDPFEIFQAFFGGAGVHPDMFGHMGFGGGGIHFAHFGGPGMRHRMGRQQHQPQHTRGSAIQVEIKLEDLYKGSKLRVSNDEIEIRKGMKEGDRVKGERNEYIIKEASHPLFTRKGDHLEYTAVVSFFEWLLNGKPNFKLTHLDGSTIAVNLLPFTETLLAPSAIVKGKGMPVAGVLFGDLMVYSSFLTKNDRESIKGLVKAFGTIIMFMMIMWNPSLLFLVLLLKPLFT